MDNEKCDYAQQTANKNRMICRKKSINYGDMANVKKLHANDDDEVNETA